jgi:N-carbamoyl-L-amino-acid hydrolase
VRGGGTVAVNPERVLGRMERLATFTEVDRPYTRRAFTPLYAGAREWLEGELRQAGLAPRIDAGGNLVGRRDGTAAGAPALMLGSHIDTVIGGGRYDGMAGVVAALEVAQALAEDGDTLRHPLAVVDFLSEEPSDYGVSCVGSRAMAGTLTPDMLTATNPQGETLAAAIARMGGDPDRLTRAPLLAPEDLAAFLELHIEQGPVLETRGAPIGIVTGIVGIRRYELDVVGQPDHAGTTPMALRKDALVGAARIIEAVNREARLGAQDDGLVATVGRIEVSPNAANVVPGQVRLTVEARSMAPERLDRFFATVVRTARDRLEQDGLSLQARRISDAAPVRCSETILETICRVAQQRGYRHVAVQSGAGHDTMQVAQLGPVGMIFVPSRAGRSHVPDEYTAPEDLQAGVEVLCETIRQLDRSLPGAA